MVGCTTTDTQPDSLPRSLPDRGIIPILDPIKPPSLTNEWEVINLDMRDIYIKEASVKIALSVLDVPYSSITISTN